MIVSVVMATTGLLRVTSSRKAAHSSLTERNVDFPWTVVSLRPSVNGFLKPKWCNLKLESNFPSPRFPRALLFYFPLRLKFVSEQYFWTIKCIDSKVNIKKVIGNLLVTLQFTLFNIPFFIFNNLIFMKIENTSLQNSITV